MIVYVCVEAGGPPALVECFEMNWCVRQNPIKFLDCRFSFRKQSVKRRVNYGFWHLCIHLTHRRPPAPHRFFFCTTSKFARKERKLNLKKSRKACQRTPLHKSARLSTLLTFGRDVKISASRGNAFCKHNAV